MLTDIFEDFVSPVTAAATLLHTAVSKRKQVLDPTMVFCVHVLNLPAEQRDPRQKDGALHMIGTLADVLLKVIILYYWFSFWYCKLHVPTSIYVQLFLTVFYLIVLQRKIYKVQLENMLVQHVYPEFKSSLGYLRARVSRVVVHIFVVTRKKFHFSCPCVCFLLGLWQSLYQLIITCPFFSSTSLNSHNP